jgi:hypothetical protein
MGKPIIRGFSFRVLHNPLPADAAALLKRAASDGANAVALIPHHYVSLEPGTARLTVPPMTFRTPYYIYPDVGQDPAHPFGNTPSPDLVYQIAREAEAQGLTVMLKPHVDSYDGAWRGYISVEGRERARQWRSAYRQFLRRYIEIAKELHNPILCMGCELYTVTKELGPGFWIEMAKWVRSRHGGNYKGQLTYASNWGIGPDAEYNRLLSLWPYLDYTSIDAYFPLVRTGTPDAISPSYEMLLAGWDKPMLDADWAPSPAGDLLALSRQNVPPFLFTEIGISNYTSAATAPGADPPIDAQRDDQLQADYYRAFRARFDNEPRFAGFFAWEMLLGQQPEISHSIVDRPAEAMAFLQE